MIKDKVIAIDFDGTITDSNCYPEIGKIRDGAKEAINKIAENNTVCIWTCRENRALERAFNFLQDNNIKFHYLNKSPYDNLGLMRKIIADYYIDDHNLFCDEINWQKISDYFNN